MPADQPLVAYVNLTSQGPPLTLLTAGDRIRSAAPWGRPGSRHQPARRWPGPAQLVESTNSRHPSRNGAGDAGAAVERADLGAMRDCFQKVTGGMQMSSWTRGSHRSDGSRSGVDIGLGAGAECGSRAGGRIRLPAIQGLSRVPLRGRTRHHSPAWRRSGRRGSSLPTARRWVWPSRSSSIPRAGR